MLLVLLTVCAAQWPAPCPGAYHASEGHYTVAFEQYSALVANFTSTRARVYNLAHNEYHTKSPAYERGVQAIDVRFWQLLVLRGQIVPQKRDMYGRGQPEPSWSIRLLGEHDEKLYWQAIKALGPKPVLPVLRPYHLLDVVGVELLAILTAHTRLVTAWQAAVFDKTHARIVFGKLPVYDTRTLTATRASFVLTGIGICNRGPIPSRAQFVQLYNETRLYT